MQCIFLNLFIYMMLVEFLDTEPAYTKGQQASSAKNLFHTQAAAPKNSLSGSLLSAAFLPMSERNSSQQKLPPTLPSTSKETCLVLSFEMILLLLPCLWGHFESQRVHQGSLPVITA